MMTRVVDSDVREYEGECSDLISDMEVVFFFNATATTEIYTE